MSTIMMGRHDPDDQPIASVGSRYIKMLLREDPISKEKPLTELQNVERVLILAAERINECLRQFPEASHLEVSFKNILERDMNPRGWNGFFLITNHADDSGINAFRSGEEEYQYYQPRRINIPSQPGDID